MRKQIIAGQFPVEKEIERLLNVEDSDMVGVDFRHLDTLIGSLCHVMDLNSDKEYREHVKSEIKMRCRDWLQHQYNDAGYYEQKDRLMTKQA